MSKYETDSEQGCCDVTQQSFGHPIQRCNKPLQETTDSLCLKKTTASTEKCPKLTVTEPTRSNIVPEQETYEINLNAIASDRNSLMKGNERGFTNLHQLSMETSNSIVIQKAIQTLKAGQNFEFDSGRQNYLGHSPLFLSILARNRTFTLEFLKAGAPINQIDYLGKTIFHYMAERNAQTYTEEIFKNYSFQTDALLLLSVWDCEGVTPMQVAVQEGNMVAFHNFNRFGDEQLKLKDKKRGYSMLHLAAERGNTYLIDLLLNKSVIDVDVMGFDDATPLHVAVSSGNIEVVRSLLDAGANPLVFLRENSLLGLVPMECEEDMRAMIAQKIAPENYQFLSENYEFDYYSDSDSDEDDQ